MFIHQIPHHRHHLLHSQEPHQHPEKQKPEATVKALGEPAAIAPAAAVLATCRNRRLEMFLSIWYSSLLFRELALSDTEGIARSDQTFWPCVLNPSFLLGSVLSDCTAGRSVPVKRPRPGRIPYQSDQESQITAARATQQPGQKRSGSSGTRAVSAALQPQIGMGRF